MSLRCSMKYMMLALLFIEFCFARFALANSRVQSNKSETGGIKTYALQLLQDAAVQILVHVPVLQGILGSLVCGGDARIEMLQVLGKADADLEGIHGFLVLA